MKSIVAQDEWQFSMLCFQRRHLIAHKSGVTDQKYISDSNDHTAELGRRIRIEEVDVERLAKVLQGIGEQLYRLLGEK
jgi:hypothetical protein